LTWNPSEEQQKEAKDALTQLSAGSDIHLAQNELALFKAHLLTDPHDFGKFICKHAELTNGFHRPLIYMLGGCVDKLIELLNNPEFVSYPLEFLRFELNRREIDWNTPEGREAFAEFLEWMDLRVYRGAAKSSMGTHTTLLWTATRNPDATIALIAGNDDGASSFMRQIRDTLQSDMYRLFFPERVPPGDLKVLWTEKRITLAGRRISSPQTNIEARGYTSEWARTHYDVFYTDDLVGQSTCSPPHLKAVRLFLSNLSGLYMPLVNGRRIIRRHIGTVYDEEDDHAFLARLKSMFSIKVPIEIYDTPPESILERGTPTNPEWHPVKEIARLQEGILGDPTEGPMSWRRNYLLDPSGAGARMFTAALVERMVYAYKHGPKAPGR
jgi:hypothetical protein